MINGLAHVAFYTSRLEETVRFYREVFQAEDLGHFDRPLANHLYTGYNGPNMCGDKNTAR